MWGGVGVGGVGGELMDCEVHSGGEEDQGQRHIRWVN